VEVLDLSLAMKMKKLKIQLKTVKSFQALRGQLLDWIIFRVRNNCIRSSSSGMYLVLMVDAQHLFATLHLLGTSDGV
jgi:hypothetical protein